MAHLHPFRSDLIHLEHIELELPRATVRRFHDEVDEEFRLIEKVDGGELGGIVDAYLAICIEGTCEVATRDGW